MLSVINKCIGVMQIKIKYIIKIYYSEKSHKFESRMRLIRTAENWDNYWRSKYAIDLDFQF